MKGRFLKILYDEEKETISQSCREFVFLGRQRQISHSFLQTFNLYSQKILMCFFVQPKVIPASETRGVLYCIAFEFRKTVMNGLKILLCGQACDQPLGEVGVKTICCGLISVVRRLDSCDRARSNRGRIWQFSCRAEQYRGCRANPCNFVVGDIQEIERSDRQSAPALCSETSLSA